MLNQERNLKRTSLAKGKKGTYKQTNKQTAAATATAASKNRKKRTTLIKVNENSSSDKTKI